MSDTTLRTRTRLIMFGALVFLGALAYLPGASGPWLFDDYGNILRNTYMRIPTLSGENLWHAAYSLQAGPLKRPIPMLTFALNAYFAGGFADTTPFKLTNMAIHGFNGVLVFWLLLLVFRYSDGKSRGGSILENTTIGPDTKAALLALLWTVHPIQLTSVLYVVQRMAELSATFVFLGLIGYLKGRMQMETRPRFATWLILVSLCTALPLGMLSKENAVLLPVFVLTIEYTLFSDTFPWRRWSTLRPRTRLVTLAALASLSAVFLVWFVQYAMSGYGGRNFTIAERALTEMRALAYYVSLILLPRINEFGLYHDDFGVSTSLIAPWTTLLSAALLALAGHGAVLAQKKRPLLSLGILWFFAGHLVESTIIPLELVHEHRNYVASLGVLLCVYVLVERLVEAYRSKWIWLSLPVLVVVFGGVTALRALQWSNELSLTTYEALHHPGSAITQSSLAMELTRYGHYRDAKTAMRVAADLEPDEASHLIWLQMLSARQKERLSNEEKEKIMELLTEKPITPTTDMMLENAISCINSWCAALQEPMESWLRTIRARKDLRDKSYYDYLLGITIANQGRLNEAAEMFRRSFAEDPQYLHPLINLAAIYIYQGNVAKAKEALSMLRSANSGNLHPRTKEIDSLAARIEKMEHGPKNRPSK